MKIYKFFANWCLPCKALAIELQDFSFPMIDVDIDDADNIEIIDKFNIKKIPFIIVADAEDNIIKKVSGGSEGRITKERLYKTIETIKENGNI